MQLTFEDIYDVKLNEEDGRKYVVDLNNNKIKIEARDPHGFWYLSQERGRMPDEYSGAYTSMTQALEALNKYLSEKNKDVYKDGKKVA